MQRKYNYCNDLRNSDKYCDGIRYLHTVEVADSNSASPIIISKCCNDLFPTLQRVLHVVLF